MSPIILESQYILRSDIFFGQHSVISQLLTAESHHHDLAAEVGVADHIGYGTDGNVSQRCVDGNAAAVWMGYSHNSVYIGILGKQFFPDPLHRHLQYSCRTLNSGHDSQQIPGSCRSLRIFIPHPGGPDRHGQILVFYQIGAELHVIYRRTLGQIQHVLVDPVPLPDVMDGISQDHPVSDDLSSGRDIAQCNLVGLGDVLIGSDALRNLSSRPDVLDRNGHIVFFADLHI